MLIDRKAPNWAQLVMGGCMLLAYLPLAFLMSYSTLIFLGYLFDFFTPGHPYYNLERHIWIKELGRCVLTFLLGLACSAVLWFSAYTKMISLRTPTPWASVLLATLFIGLALFAHGDDLATVFFSFSFSAAAAFFVWRAYLFCVKTSQE